MKKVNNNDVSSIKWKEPNPKMLDVAEARKFLGIPPLGEDRKLKKDTVLEYKDKMKKGLFHTGQLAIAKLNGNVFRLNGQHVAEAVIRGGIPAWVTIQTAECKDDNDLILAYCQFDDNRIRTLGDLAKVKASILGLPNYEYIRLFVQSLLFYWGDFDGYSTKHKKLEKLERTHRKRFDFVDSILCDPTLPYKEAKSIIRHIKRAAAVGVMMRTFDTGGEAKAREFWIAVRDGEGLKRSDPAYRLRDYLRGTKSSSGRIARPVNGSFEVPPIHWYYWCIKCWNRYVQNEPMQAINEKRGISTFEEIL